MNKVIEKYNGISLPAKASLWFIVCSLIQKGISFFTTPLFTRIISPSEYGEVVLYSSWMELITIFATFQLATGVFNKAMVKFANDRDGYTSSSLVLTSIITVALFGVYSIFSNLLDKLFDLSHILIVMMFVEIFFSTAMSFWSIRNRFEYKYVSVIFLTLLVSILGPLMGVLLIINVDSTNQAEAKVLGLLIIKVIIYSVVFCLIIKKGKKLVVLDYWKYSLSYNLPLIPHYLSQQVLTQSDRIMINSICGKADAAIYGVAYQVSMAAFLFTYAIHTSFTPWTFEKIKIEKYDDIGKRALAIEVLIGVLCFGFSLFAPELINILGGDSYLQAIWIVPPVAMSVLFQTIYTFFGNVEFYFEKTKFVMIASIICALSNLGLNAIFIPLYGFVAAGYTTLFCYVLYAIVHYLFMLKIQRDQGLDRIYNGKMVWTIGTLFIGLSILVSILYRYFVIRYAFVVLLLFVFAVMWKKKKIEIINILR